MSEENIEELIVKYREEDDICKQLRNELAPHDEERKRLKNELINYLERRGEDYYRGIVGDVKRRWVPRPSTSPDIVDYLEKEDLRRLLEDEDLTITENALKALKARGCIPSVDKFKVYPPGKGYYRLEVNIFAPKDSE